MTPTDRIHATQLAMGQPAGYIPSVFQNSHPVSHPGADRMISIDESYVDAAASNADAAKNGRGLVLKNKLTKLGISPDGALIFGECQGSGKDPYKVSCDFARPDQPTHRCSCPSRQLPCKHRLGLMYAFVMGKKFAPAAVPADLQAKREETHSPRREEESGGGPAGQAEAGEPGGTRQEGEGPARRHHRAGAADPRRGPAGHRQHERQARPRDGEAGQPTRRRLPARRPRALFRYTQLFADEGGKFAQKSAGRAERVHTEALDQLARLHAVIKQGRAYLAKRLEDPNLAIPTDTPIAAWLGHAWQLTELKVCGLLETDAELVQLAFNSHDDPAAAGVHRHRHLDDARQRARSASRRRSGRTRPPSTSRVRTASSRWRR